MSVGRKETETPSLITGEIFGKNRQKWKGKPARVAKVRDLNVAESTRPGAGGATCEMGEQGWGRGSVAGSGSAGFSGALNDPAISLALNTLGPAICHKPQASLCAIRLPLNCAKLALGFFTLCLYRTGG